MKVGFVTGEFPPMEGGVGAFTQALAIALADPVTGVLNDAGHEIHIISSRQARPLAAGSRPSWHERQEPVDIGFATLHPTIRRWRWPLLATVAGVVLRYELDLVNVQYQAAAYDMRSPAIHFLPWRLKGLVKRVITFHDLRVPYLFPKAGRLREMALRFMAHQADGVIVTNAGDYQALAPYLQSPIRQIPIGSNIKAHIPTAVQVAAARSRLGLTQDQPLLGYFGFLNESKGADTLLHALAQSGAQADLVFIGGRTGASDPQNNQTFFARLDALIHDLGLDNRVHWTGFVADADVSAYLCAADLMVMPYRDGVSLRRGTLMAALAHGRALITTKPVHPLPELVHGQNVWLVPPGDTAALVQSIETLMAAPDLRARLGQGAFQVASQFTWPKIAAQTAEFYEEILVGGA